MRKYYGGNRPDNTEDKVANHYSSGKLLDDIMNALKDKGGHIKAEDLAPMEDFHLRGREATKEMAELLSPAQGSSLLDIGCGIGGTSRFLASTYKCHVTGIDLSPEFVFVAEQLTKQLGLENNAEFYKASATALPFEDHSFNFAVSQHINMNIRDKDKYVSETSRVLRPGGKFGIYELFMTGEPRFKFPVPWADDEEISFLTDWENFSRLLSKNNMSKTVKRDVSPQAIEWMKGMAEKLKGGEKMSGQVVLGEDMGLKFRNLLEAFQEKSLVAIQAVYTKKDV